MRAAKFTAAVALAFAASATGGFYAGRSSLSAPSPRTLASGRPTVNDISKLPCPSEEKFKELAEKVHLVAELEGTSTCDDSQKGKLAKLLLLLETLNTKAPDGWGGAAHAMVENPLQYVVENTPVMKLDLNQQSSVAYNFAGKEINLGGLFFASEPLYALMVLVHEAHHSDPKDPAHDRCRAGDIPKTEGGCDDVFSIAEDAGAYSYSVLFYLGMAQFHDDLAPEDREYLYSAALTMIGNRFNQVPLELAQPYDELLLLGQSGQGYLLHPFTLEARPVPELQNFRRLEHNPKLGGAFLYNKDDQVFAWSRLNPVSRFYSEWVPEDMHIRDVNRFYLAVEKYPHFMFFNDRSEMWFLDTDTRTGIDKLALFRVQPKDDGIDPMRAFTGDFFSAFLISTEGKLYKASMGGRGRAKDRYEAFRSFEGKTWTQGTGGIVYDALYGISEGKLFRLGTEKEKSGFHPVLSDFQGQGSLKKYYEATNFRVLLNDEGKIFLRRFESEMENQLSPSPDDKIEDFTVVRHFTPTPSILEPKRAKLANFLNDCRARDVQMDPWTLNPMGISANGFLVLSGAQKGQCVELKKLGKVNAYHFSASALGSWNNFYSQVTLEISGPGGAKRTVFPYSAPLAE